MLHDPGVMDRDPTAAKWFSKWRGKNQEETDTKLDT
jgi:hypothetical protein